MNEHYTGMDTGYAMPARSMPPSGVAPGHDFHQGFVQLPLEHQPRHPKGLSVPHGIGTPLGDILAVKEGLQRIEPDSDVIKGLHMLMYGNAGKKTQRKRDIRVFYGFDPTDGKHELRKEQLLSTRSWTTDQLKNVCHLLGLERGGNKNALVNRIIDFLYNPDPAVTRVPSKRATKSGSGVFDSGRRRTKKDPFAPKKPMTAYFAFAQEVRPHLKAQYPDRSVTDIARVIGEKWRELTDAQKKPYEAISARDKKRYEREMANYTPPTDLHTGGRKKKDPLAPKRPRSAYFLFANDKRAEVAAAHPEFGVLDVGRKLGELWRHLDTASKKIYEEASVRDKVRYEREKAAYEATKNMQQQQ